MCVLMLFLVVTAAAGYLLDCLAGAASGLLIPLESFVVVWHLGTR
jgi:hypothetical protein